MSDPHDGAGSAPVGPVPPEPVTPEPVTPEPPDPLRRTLLHQSWLDVAFVHWAVAPETVGGLLPRGVRPDVYEGATYVGLIALRMHRVGWLQLPGVPYFGNFPETNVRLYSVDGQGRRGVVFRSFEASRLLPVLIARLGFGLPYMWAGMSVHRKGDDVEYATRRRWPRAGGSGGAHARLGLRIGARIAEPSGLEDFLTARWGMHSDRRGRTLYLPNTHPRWGLHRAELLHLDENLITAAGLPCPAGPPVSVLFSPGVPVRFGPPA